MMPRLHSGPALLYRPLPSGWPPNRGLLTRGLDPALNSVRVANSIARLRHGLIALSRECGVVHPAVVTCDHLDIPDGRFAGTPAAHVFDYQSGWGCP